VIISDGKERVDSVILGIDVKHDPATTLDTAASSDNVDVTGIIDDDDDDDDNSNDENNEAMNGESVATVGLVLPITSGLSVTIAGQGYVLLLYHTHTTTHGYILLLALHSLSTL